MTKPRLGAHMSIAGGPANALLRGDSIACDTIQMFTRSSNRWQSKALSPEEIHAFEAARQETGIHPIIAHSSYLINLASPKEALWQRSVEALITELTRCRQLDIRNYVLHPGHHTGSGEKKGLARAAEGLCTALQATAGDDVTILLENTAGQGTGLGYTFEHLSWLMEHTEPQERLGVCFDTAHAFAAGYEFRQPGAYGEMWDTFDNVIGLDNLGVIHLNDSKRELGSRVDRHEQIGEGYIGRKAFRLLVNDERLRHVPMILETPKGPGLKEDVKALALLRGFIQGERIETKA
ncbi:MAG: deoxyribonuclease IV [Anaerolineales bacterium]